MAGDCRDQAAETVAHMTKALLPRSTHGQQDAVHRRPQVEAGVRHCHPRGAQSPRSARDTAPLPMCSRTSTHSCWRNIAMVDRPGPCTGKLSPGAKHILAAATADQILHPLQCHLTAILSKLRHDDLVWVNGLAADPHHLLIAEVDGQTARLAAVPPNRLHKSTGAGRQWSCALAVVIGATSPGSPLDH